jgi:DNA-directed RNA polymerase I subunit RPA2
MNQEILLGGHLYLMFVKEKLQEWLQALEPIIAKLLTTPSARKISYDEDPEGFLRNACDKNFDIGRRLEYFLATGNLVSSTGLGLMQTSGYCIIAEKLNFLRYISHFRCVHRGAFFAAMKTTSVRKLIPDSWGFFCPVHTPDGAPCGLLNHLTANCKIITTQAKIQGLPALLCSLGMSPVGQSTIYPKEFLDVVLDGEIIGYVPPQLAQQLADKIRYLKVKKQEQVPPTLEIGLVLPGASRQFPGLFLFSSPARMMRTVRYLPTNELELIGSFEQVYMNIACVDEDRNKRTIYTHQELSPMTMLSVVASLTPFSDMNQSPRNMYQCQMAKQSMATPGHAMNRRVDNKVYRIQTPQSPVCKTAVYKDYDIDQYPIGANAIVAVISYTGYDMEDAMIVNKAAFERGFGHASVYKTEILDVGPSGKEKRGDGRNCFFANPLVETTAEGGAKIKKLYCPELDQDGLPTPGTHLEQGTPIYCVTDYNTGQSHIKKWKLREPAIVEEVRIVGSAPRGVQRAAIKYRLNRNPVIGDKFSSRHGQKGVMSQLWPAESMPFSESGMTPDVIINPHAFPSRMTIAMLVESMASKSGCLHGINQDATPFRFDENHTAVDYFGEQLVKAGYNYYGNEPMYSGVTGGELRADIYLGVVYYQRLRHMVSDKYQVRSTGPVHNLTQQPIKGRSKGGGIRFGEMERDCLLAHGTSFLLHDRLMKSSDYHKSYVCKLCGSILAPVMKRQGPHQQQITCRYCDSNEGITVIALPFVFRYLTAELAAMNIRSTLFVK